ncbi:hypothetical protein [Halorubrum sp. Ea8]|nr:hypothetical protein [Halorubrum sp. Ea8]
MAGEPVSDTPSKTRRERVLNAIDNEMIDTYTKTNDTEEVSQR